MTKVNNKMTYSEMLEMLLRDLLYYITQKNGTTRFARLTQMNTDDYGIVRTIKLYPVEG